MLRLAAKLLAFFWRRADGTEEEAGPQAPELAEGACGAGRGAARLRMPALSASLGRRVPRRD